MRYLSIIFSVVFILAIAVSASAQLYEYRDANGNIRFTDDLGSIPDNQLDNVKTIQGKSSPTPKLYGWPDPAQEEVEPPSQAVEEQAETSEVGLAERYETLSEEQAALQDEYDRIEEAKALLGNPPENDASREEIDAYGNKVEAINKRTMAYQKKLDDHEARVKEYNARFAQ